AGRKEVRRLGGKPGTRAAMVFSPKGQTLISADFDGTVRQWEGATGKELHHFKSQAAIPRPEFSRDGKTLATRDAQGGIHVWDAARGMELRRIKAGANAWTLSPDGRGLATWGCADHLIHFWDTATGKKQGQLKLEDEGIPGGVTCLAFSPDGR